MRGCPPGKISKNEAKSCILSEKKGGSGHPGTYTGHAPAGGGGDGAADGDCAAPTGIHLIFLQSEILSCSLFASASSRLPRLEVLQYLVLLKYCLVAWPLIDENLYFLKWLLYSIGEFLSWLIAFCSFCCACSLLFDTRVCRRDV